jgi:hypothetical protein
MKIVSRGLAAALLLMSMAVLSTACKAKVGDSCTAGTAACQDDKNGLACEGGKFIAVPCKGAKGCSVANDQVTCDASGNAAGDICGTDSEGNGDCTPDGKSAIVCKSGKWAINACSGGCIDNGKTVTCNQ